MTLRCKWPVSITLVFLTISVVATARFTPSGTGDAPLVLRGHTNVVGAVALSQDGKWIASASMDHTVRIWDAATGRPGSVLRSPADEEQYAVAFSPNAQELASTGRDGKVSIWDFRSGRLLRSLSGFPDWSITLAYSPDGKELAVGGMDGSVTIYDPATATKLRSFKTQKMVSAIAYSPDGKLVASGLATVELSDPKSGRTVGTLKGPQNIISAVEFSPDGRLIAAASWDKTVHIWNVTSGDSLRVIKPAAVLPEGVSINEMPENRKQTIEERLTLPVTGIAFSPDGSRLAVAGADKILRLFDLSDGRQTAVLRGHERAITSVAFSRDGKRLVTGSADKSVRVWRIH